MSVNSAVVYVSKIMLLKRNSTICTFQFAFMVRTSIEQFVHALCFVQCGFYPIDCHAVVNNVLNGLQL